MLIVVSFSLSPVVFIFNATLANGDEFSQGTTSIDDNLLTVTNISNVFHVTEEYKFKWDNICGLNELDYYPFSN